MSIARLGLVSFVAVGIGIAACAPPLPPTITPAPPATPDGSTVQEIQINPPAGGTPGSLAVVPRILLAATAPYRDADGAFSMAVPVGWPESRQPIDPAKGDVKLGTFFQPPERNGLVSVTQFDSGQRPAAIGVTINQVLEMSGVLDQPNFREINREKVYERENDAMRVEMTYTRSDGVNMHSLVLFQIDGTTFSMVHVGVEEDSWLENQGRIRDLLATYRVPAAAD